MKSMYPKDLSEYKNAVQYLEKSPMFNLSLSSNELFHSNFLYWIWKSDKETFGQIINGLVGDKDFWENNCNSKNIEVRREYKNFDLSIVEVRHNVQSSNKGENTKTNENSNSDNDYKTDGVILFALENKVKSIPYAQQLIDYKKKIEEHNEKIVKKEESQKQHKAKMILLSLSDAFPDITLDEKGCCNGWQRKSYNDYLKLLNGVTLREYDNVRVDYCKYVEGLITSLKEWDRSLDKEESKVQPFWEYPYLADAEKLRLHVLYYKYNYAKLCCGLMERLKKHLQNVQYISKKDDRMLLTGKDSKKKVKEYDDYFEEDDFLIGVGYDYSNQKPIIEVKVTKKHDKTIYIIQVQGENYEHGIIKHNSRRALEEEIHKDDTLKSWVSKIEGKDIFSTEVNTNTCNGYNDTFSMVYKYRKLKEKTTIDEVFNQIVNDVKTLSNP